jgi:drug/metabolite transporter (DMT)-like permease
MAMNIVPLILGLMLAFSFGTSDFLSKGVTAKIGSYRTTLLVLALSGIGALAPALLLKSSFAVTPFFGAVLVLSAVTTFLAFASLYRAYRSGLLSLASPIANAYPAFSVAISVAFLGVKFSIGALLALSVIIVGIVLVSTSLSDLRKRIFNRDLPLAPGVGSAFLAAVFFGVSWTLFGYASEHLGYLLPSLAVRLGAVIVGLALIPVIKPEIGPTSGRWIPTILLMALLETVGIVIFSLGVVAVPSPGTIPILATFGGMSAAVTVTYAIVILKERLELNHIIGVISLLAGVVALLYLTG